jgi:hypothetical protein
MDPVLVLPRYIQITLSARPGYYSYYCERCSVWFVEQEFAYRNLYSHLYSRYHEQRMELHAENKCNTCNIQFPSRSKMAAHVETKRHKLKEAGIPISNIRCEPCDVKFLCNAHYMKHLATPKHAKKLNPPPPKICEMCKFTGTTEKQMATHLATNKHKRNMVEGGV